MYLTVAKQMTGVPSIIEDEILKSLEDKNDGLIHNGTMVGIWGSPANY